MWGTVCSKYNLETVSLSGELEYNLQTLGVVCSTVSRWVGWQSWKFSPLFANKKLGWSNQSLNCQTQCGDQASCKSSAKPANVYFHIDTISFSIFDNLRNLDFKIIMPKTKVAPGAIIGWDGTLDCSRQNKPVCRSHWQLTLFHSVHFKHSCWIKQEHFLCPKNKTWILTITLISCMTNIFTELMLFKDWSLHFPGKYLFYISCQACQVRGPNI